MVGASIVVGIRLDKLLVETVTTTSITKYDEDTGKPYQVPKHESSWTWMGNPCQPPNRDGNFYDLRKDLVSRFYDIAAKSGRIKLFNGGSIEGFPIESFVVGVSLIGGFVGVKEILEDAIGEAANHVEECFPYHASDVRLYYLASY